MIQSNRRRTIMGAGRCRGRRAGLMLAFLLAATLGGCSAHRERVVALPSPAPVDAPDQPADRPETPGERVETKTAPPRVHVVAPGETLWRIARLHGIDLHDLAHANGITDPARIAVGQRLMIPEGSALGRETGVEAPPAAHAVSEAGAAFDWPVRGRVSSGFGTRRGRRVHEGIDILVPTGTPVIASEQGKVRFAGWRGAYGQLVIVDHDDGVASYYAHNSRLLVRRGERVDRGQRIAASGRTGNATAPHVHFEVRVGGAPVNPLEHLAE